MADETKLIDTAPDNELLSRYSDFLTGKPLNDELAAVQLGDVHFTEETTTDFVTGTAKSVQVRENELTRAERVELREFRQSGGWSLAMQLLEKRFQNLHKRAISMGEDDPLEKRDALAKEWAYVMMYRRAMIEFQMLIDAELKALWETEKANG